MMCEVIVILFVFVVTEAQRIPLMSDIKLLLIKLARKKLFEKKIRCDWLTELDLLSQLEHTDWPGQLTLDNIKDHQ